MFAGMNKGINSAYKRLKVISQDDNKRREYDARMKAIRDYNQGIIEAEERGERRGEQRGLEKGIRFVAQNLISQKFSIGQIVEATGLKVEDVRKMMEIEGEF